MGFIIMITVYYSICFVVSFILSTIYVYTWRRRFDAHMTCLFVIIPLVNLSYLLMTISGDAGVALAMIKLIYIGGTFLPWFILMCITGLCRIELKSVTRVCSFIGSGIMYGCVLTIGELPLYYKSLSLEKVNDRWVQHREYGILHTVFYIFVGVYFILTISTIVYSFLRKKQVSRKLLFLLTLPQILTLIGYIANHFLGDGLELLPVSYCLSQAVYLRIVDKIPLYDVNDMVVESMIHSDDTGFITIDFNHCYLGSNETAKQIIPALSTTTVDSCIENIEGFQNNVLTWLKHFEEDETKSKSMTVRRDPASGEEQIFIVTVSFMYDGSRRRGYQIVLQDDTQNQGYINLIDKYNSELEEEIAAKTDRIMTMHDNLVLSIATLVESRDNSTGGHIKRTSDGVRILMDEIEKEQLIEIPKDFGKKLIKAAPMHDLGKIAVDDAILRKPGRFTPEEFEKMKTHAAQGARIVFDILRGTDDKAFKIIAENVAHYHHERWDGSGYPEGRRGNDIPLEARIMAIADVYDALVSRRAYKEKLSFDEANDIILDGMGKHFDPKLKNAYEKARPRLEAYYATQE